MKRTEAIATRPPEALSFYIGNQNSEQNEYLIIWEKCVFKTVWDKKNSLIRLKLHKFNNSMCWYAAHRIEQTITYTQKITDRLPSFSVLGG